MDLLGNHVCTVHIFHWDAHDILIITTNFFCFVFPNLILMDDDEMKKFDLVTVCSMVSENCYYMNFVDFAENVNATKYHSGR